MGSQQSTLDTSSWLVYCTRGLLRLCWSQSVLGSCSCMGQSVYVSCRQIIDCLGQTAFNTFPLYRNCYVVTSGGLMVKGKCKLGTALSPVPCQPPLTPACHFLRGCNWECMCSLEWFICSRGLTAAHMPALTLVLVEHAQNRACYPDTHPVNHHTIVKIHIRESFANLETNCKALQIKILPLGGIHELYAL